MSKVTTYMNDKLAHRPELLCKMLGQSGLRQAFLNALGSAMTWWQGCHSIGAFSSQYSAEQMTCQCP